MHKKQDEIFIVLATDAHLKHVTVVIMQLATHVTLFAMEHVTPPDQFALLANESSLAFVRVSSFDICKN